MLELERSINQLIEKADAKLLEVFEAETPVATTTGDLVGMTLACIRSPQDECYDDQITRNVDLLTHVIMEVLQSDRAMESVGHGLAMMQLRKQQSAMLLLLQRQGEYRKVCAELTRLRGEHRLAVGEVTSADRVDLVEEATARDMEQAALVKLEPLRNLAEIAIGKQLDAIGAMVMLDRGVTGTDRWTDEEYREQIMEKLRVDGADGTLAGADAAELLRRAFRRADSEETPGEAALGAPEMPKS